MCGGGGRYCHKFVVMAAVDDTEKLTSDTVDGTVEADVAGMGVSGGVINGIRLLEGELLVV